MKSSSLAPLVIACSVVLGGQAAAAGAGPKGPAGADSMTPVDNGVEPHPADEFLDRIALHCGEAFAGRIVANEPARPDDPFDGKKLVMHVRECGQNEVRIPFHVGDDHSRTWVLTRTTNGLRLKHDHRHVDGTADVVSLYGGETPTPGNGMRQVFPADEYSVELFLREGLHAGVTNTWAMEIEPGKRFLYELSRPGGRLFQVEFDLTTPVPTPPTPWGYTEFR